MVPENGQKDVRFGGSWTLREPKGNTIRTGFGSGVAFEQAEQKQERFCLRLLITERNTIQQPWVPGSCLSGSAWLGLSPAASSKLQGEANRS